MILLLLVRAKVIKYAIMVDAGSSGTRAHIYKWEKSKGIPNVNPAPNRTNGWVYKSKIPLAKAHKNSSIIEFIFKPIIKFSMKRIPPENYPTTRIFVFATAGVRLLSEEDQLRVISQTYEYLQKNSPFKLKPRYVQAITGVEEGIFGWLSVNHLLGRLTSKSTIGALDMGGASSQISFRIKKLSGSPDEHTVNLGNHHRITIFSHSYLGYGANEALKTITNYLESHDNHHNPCYPVNYSGHHKLFNFSGTGNFHECTQLVESVLLSQPEITDVVVPNATNEYVAMAAYFYLNDFLKLRSNSTLSELRQRTTEFCSRDWESIEREYPHNSYVVNYCWYGIYQWNVLTKVYHFNDNTTNVMKIDNIDGVDLSWTIGAMLKEASNIELDDRNFDLFPFIAMNAFLAVNIIVKIIRKSALCRKKGSNFDA
ncbi:ectonucleoside triphosphate diphosphohydrolase 1 [Histomonas meleagridis]|uniref:ectonucleoside triphosphate diphosphohydrolase 1 n=1 Tax=Histomonas meleagridis TaxID=135588 RepID=UPI0035594DD5|nr:ectonucleoside triphosphate diphosphohydrolase 1 [Histomonas meleagridis]KAH0798641.1 ectonucleoside triphosphate diphosphohydrolase 1 [Histomonas meleagridis]